MVYDGGDGGLLDARDSSTLISCTVIKGGIAHQGSDPDPHMIKRSKILYSFNVCVYCINNYYNYF